MRYFITILLLCFFFKSNAQDSVPRKQFPFPIWNDWVRSTKQVMADSGFNTTFVDTAFRPKYPMIIMSSFNHKPYYFDMVKWNAFAAPSTGFVLYSDSSTLYVTLTRQKDSLANYVTLYSPQTILSTAPKTWNADQTFNDSVNINSVLTLTTPAHTQSVFKDDDSLRYISPDGDFIFKNRISALNQSYTLSKGLNPLLAAKQRLYLNKQQDTIIINGNGAASFNAIEAFLKKNNSDDTVNVFTTMPNSSFLKTISGGIEVTTDTALITDKTTYWNLKIPFAINYSYTGVTNHGHIDRVTDYDIGNTYFLDGSLSDSLFKIARHEGIYIENISGNAINQSGIAIYQNGLNDSVILKSKAIQTPNLVTTGTAAFSLLEDVNGNWIKKSYIPPVTAALNFPSTAAQTNSDLTITVTGAASGDLVVLGVPAASVEDNTCYTAFVSSANTITVRFNNYGAGAKDPNSATFKVQVIP